PEKLNNRAAPTRKAPPGHSLTAHLGQADKDLLAQLAVEACNEPARLIQISDRPAPPSTLPP
ncbi:MAG TPA: hypothetical protein VJQ83_08995, partial [Tepidiformaceae bacterium]|nr:hypothetical protein [Tepidiformaceae bacterium]